MIHHFFTLSINSIIPEPAINIDISNTINVWRLMIGSGFHSIRLNSSQFLDFSAYFVLPLNIVSQMTSNSIKRSATTFLITTLLSIQLQESISFLALVVIVQRQPPKSLLPIIPDCS